MLPSEPSPEFKDAVHQALQLWTKEPAAGSQPAVSSPLANLTLVKQAAQGSNIRCATSEALLAALKLLAAEHESDAELLQAHFLDGKTVFAVANERNIAESTVYKLQRQAIDRLAAALLSLEQTASAARIAALESRLPPPTYDQLFGVEAHLRHLRGLLIGPNAVDMVSIEGLGGIGKTALARQLVRMVAQTEAAFVEFGWISAQQISLHPEGGIRPVHEPTLSAEGLVEALAAQILAGAPASPGRALSALEVRLRQVPHLIVVDNLETIADVESLLPTLARLAGPSKFLLTSREALRGQPGIHHFTVPELSEAEALDLVRHVGRLNDLPHVVHARDAELRNLFATVGGNPLALRLVTGQFHLLRLAQVVGNLREARGKCAEELYHFIYREAWRRLPTGARDVLMLMPRFAQDGADLAAIQRASGLAEDALIEALACLARLSLVTVSGDLHTRCYGVHRLTRTFLLREVTKWQASLAPPA